VREIFVAAGRALVAVESISATVGGTLVGVGRALVAVGRIFVTVGGTLVAVGVFVGA